MDLLSSIFPVFIPQIARATPDFGGTVWKKYLLNPVLQAGPSDWDAFEVSSGNVIKTSSGYSMYYAGRSSPWSFHYAIGLATSTDGKSWTKFGTNPILDVGPSGAWDSGLVANPSVIQDDAELKMYYIGSDGAAYNIGLATSSDGVSWVKHPAPVLRVGDVGEWDSALVANPSVIKDGSTYKMWYQGGDGLTTKIGYATSNDGVTWLKHTGPVLERGPSGFWDALASGLELPSVVKDGSVFMMWYFAALIGVIGYATSNDGVNWSKFDQPVLTPTPESWDSGVVMEPKVLIDGAEYKMYYTGRAPGIGNAIGLATSPRVIPATIDIDPNTLNLKSKGKWVTCYIELPQGYYANDIDVSTVKLWHNGDLIVSAELHPTEIGDHDGDGIPDLMVKVDRQALIEYLKTIPESEVELTVTGEIAGTPFEGSDTVRVINKGKK